MDSDLNVHIYNTYINIGLKKKGGFAIVRHLLFYQDRRDAYYVQRRWQTKGGYTACNFQRASQLGSRFSYAHPLS